MKVIMTDDGKVSYNGYEEVKYKKKQDISTIPRWAKDYFLKTNKAKEVIEKSKIEKEKNQKRKESKSIKNSPENKMIKTKDMENK